ncbi:MAG: integration host factor subunit beta [Candidatus Marinimicrobia bacterium]|nr:integration host factor subunit beta [Candidatus Neomarinimicrobiota bacterium]
MNTYTRMDIIRDVSEKLDIPEVKMKKILDSILNSMVEILTKPSSNTRIELRNFGVFEVKPTKAKPRARNPRTNKEVYVPPHRKIHFRPGKSIRDVILQEWIDK